MPNLHPAGSIYHFFRWLQFTFSAYLRQCFSNQLREKMPCQSIPVNGKLLAGCGKKKPSGEPGTPVSQGKEIRAGEYNGRTVSFRLPDKRRGTLSDGTGHGKFRRTAEAPCDGTDGRVPFVLPPDVRLRPCSLPKWSETDAGTGQPVRQGLSARQWNPFHPR